MINVRKHYNHTIASDFCEESIHTTQEKLIVLKNNLERQATKN